MVAPSVPSRAILLGFCSRYPLIFRYQVQYMSKSALDGYHHSHFIWVFASNKQKKGKLSTSHRYDLLPLLRSSPGGIRRELVVYDFPDCKYSQFLNTVKNKWQKVLYFVKLSDLFSTYKENLHRTFALELILDHHLTTCAAWSHWFRNQFAVL